MVCNYGMLSIKDGIDTRLFIQSFVKATRYFELSKMASTHTALFCIAFVVCISSVICYNTRSAFLQNLIHGQRLEDDDVEERMLDGEDDAFPVDDVFDDDVDDAVDDLLKRTTLEIEERKLSQSQQNVILTAHRNARKNVNPKASNMKRMVNNSTFSLQVWSKNILGFSK